MQWPECLCCCNRIELWLQISSHIGCFGGSPVAKHWRKVYSSSKWPPRHRQNRGDLVRCPLTSIKPWKALPARTGPCSLNSFGRAFSTQRLLLHTTHVTNCNRCSSTSVSRQPAILLPCLRVSPLLRRKWRSSFIWIADNLQVTCKLGKPWTSSSTVSRCQLDYLVMVNRNLGLLETVLKR